MSLVFCVVFCRTLFLPLFLFLFCPLYCLSFLDNTASDYPFGISKLFFFENHTGNYYIIGSIFLSSNMDNLSWVWMYNWIFCFLLSALQCYYLSFVFKPFSIRFRYIIIEEVKYRRGQKFNYVNKIVRINQI